MKKKSLGLFTGSVVTMLLISCNNGSGGANTHQQLLVTSTDINSTVFVANLGFSAAHSYQVIIDSNVSPALAKYTLKVQLPGSQFSVESNQCVNIVANQSCNIHLSFTPITPADYTPNNVITFAVGNLDSSIVVTTQPQA